MFYVDGWVNTPGLVRSDVPLTVSRAIAQAGGVKTGANTDGILVLRRARRRPDLLLPGRARQLRRRRRNAEDPLLKSYDVVYVPQSMLGLGLATSWPPT